MYAITETEKGRIQKLQECAYNILIYLKKMNTPLLLIRVSFLKKSNFFYFG